MIPVVLLAGALLAGVLVYTFWGQIKEFLKNALEKVKRVVNAAIVGFTTYVQKRSISAGLKAFHKFYSKNQQGKWQETVVTKEISESEIPEHIQRKLARAEGREVEITDELQHELGV